MVSQIVSLDAIAAYRQSQLVRHFRAAQALPRFVAANSARPVTEFPYTLQL